MAKVSTLTDEQKAAKQVEKAAKFTDLAQKRVGKALDALATLRGLANRSSYVYTDDQVAKIFSAVNAEMDLLAGLFKAGEAKAKTGSFTF